MATTPTSTHAALISQKDTTYTKIFVGGLPYHTTDSSLKEYFEKFGEIDEAVVITDRQTGKSRGYGFVSTSIIFLCYLFFFSFFSVRSLVGWLVVLRKKIPNISDRSFLRE